MRTLRSVRPALMTALVGLLGTGTAMAGKNSLVLPTISAQVLDQESGQPAANVTVELSISSGGDAKSYRQVATVQTDANGQAEIPSQFLDGAKKLHLTFSWDSPDVPKRSIVYKAKLGKGGKVEGGNSAKVEKPGAYYVAGLDNDGKCGNLFKTQASSSAVQIQFSRPSSYLACQEPKFKFGNLDAIGSRNINKGRMNFFSFNDDLRMGQEFSVQVGGSSENPVLQDEMIGDYVQGLIDRIGKASDTPDLQFKVRVIDADVLNAFAVPGGYVFVYRGLLEAAETEAELVGVLAHEVAHVTSRHGTEGMTSAIAKVVGAIVAGEIVASQIKGDNDVARAVVKDLVLTGTQFWILGGTRKREAEADHLGAQYAWRAGYDPRGLASFFGKFQQARGYKQTRLEQFFSDHPNDDVRIADVSRKVDYFLPPRHDLIVSSDDFKAVKARLSGMPPAKASGELAANALFSSLKSANEAIILKEVQAYIGDDEAQSQSQEGSLEDEEEPASTGDEEEE